MEYIIILLLLEFMELKWHKGDNVKAIILYQYGIFNHNIWIYFSLQFSFIYLIFLSIYLNIFNFWMINLIILKVLENVLRIYLFSELNKGNNDLFDELFNNKDIKTSNRTKYISPIISAFMLFMALSG